MHVPQFVNPFTYGPDIEIEETFLPDGSGSVFPAMRPLPDAQIAA